MDSPPPRARFILHPSAFILRSRVVLTSLVVALSLLGDSLLYVVLPLHGAALGLSAFQVGVLLSANRFVRMLTNTGASRLMRRLPNGLVFTGATALAAATTAWYTLAPAFLSFLVARFLWGFCFSVLRLGCFITVLQEATDRSRGRLMGTYQSISRAGSLTATIVGVMLFDAFGYRAAILVMAAGTLLAVPVASRVGGWGPRPPASAPAPPPVRRRRVRLPDLRDPLEARLLAVKWSAFSLSFVARGVVTATLALFLLRQFGDRFGPGGAIGVATVAGWLIGVRWLSEIGLAPPLGALSDRLGRARMATGWLLAATIALTTLAFAPAVGVAVVAASALFVSASGLGATLDAAAGDLAPPHRRAEVMSSYADWADLGAALGPLLALTFAGDFGPRPSYLAGSVLLLSGAVAVLVAFRPAPAVRPATAAEPFDARLP